MFINTVTFASVEFSVYGEDQHAGRLTDATVMESQIWREPWTFLVS